MNDSIRERYVAIHKDQRNKRSELMREYNDKVFYPALQDLKDECAASGHGPGHAWDDGHGQFRVSCTACGCSIE